MRLGALKVPRVAGTLLRLGVLMERLGALLRLGLLNELLRLGELNELPRLELLNEPLLRLGPAREERLTDGELCPPPRLPPPGRCAIDGAKLSVRPTIASAINFEVFILLLLSYLFVFAF